MTMTIALVRSRDRLSSVRCVPLSTGWSITGWVVGKSTMNVAPFPGVLVAAHRPAMSLHDFPGYICEPDAGPLEFSATVQSLKICENTDRDTPLSESDSIAATLIDHARRAGRRAQRAR